MGGNKLLAVAKRATSLAIPRRYVSPRRTQGYLLNTKHHRGKHKAAQLIKFGFHPTYPKILEEALVGHADNPGTTEDKMSEYGCKRVCTGSLLTPTGIKTDWITVWLLRKGTSFWELITTYSGK